TVAIGGFQNVQARSKISLLPGNDQTVAGLPAVQATQHDVGNMVLGIWNNGIFGDQGGGVSDVFTGRLVKACEFPKGSDTRYLYSGGFWIGAVLGRDTLVSLGYEGWTARGEMFPDQAPLGNMVYRSIIDPSKPEYDDAVSEQDFIAVYYDTCSYCRHSLYVQVTQRSFAWSYSYAQNFVLFDYAIKNIGRSRLKKVYLGIFVDADVHTMTNVSGAGDDICGFRRSLPAWYAPSGAGWEDTVNVAWVADNDGDMNVSPPLGPVPNVTGTRIIRTPSDSLKVSFNWWGPNGDPRLDFGPQGRRTYRDLGHGGLGTPNGDQNEYYFLRNNEFDYDQIFTASILPTDTQWMYPPQDYAGTWSMGSDTRYLLSFGPFDIDPGQTLPLSFAYVGGLGFHKDRNNLTNLPNNPGAFYNNLDFSNLGYNCTWASWIYDTPGYDSDSDGFAGNFRVYTSGILEIDTTVTPPETTFAVNDTFWTSGDGVPDFKGASPPPAPTVRLLPSVGRILVRFNGLRSETTPDAFTKKLDWEGYRVYYSRDDRASSYSLLESFDKQDFNKYVWDVHGYTGAWALKDIPYTLRELRCRYAPDSCDDSTWNPLLYTRENPFHAPGFPDSIMYFAPQDYNRSELGVSTRIVKRFPNQEKPAILNKDSCLATDTTEDGYFKYYEYEYEINDVLPTVLYYVSVTAFDFGSPSSGLPSLETPRHLQPNMSYALASSDTVAVRNLKIEVYPNPYRIDGNYAADGYEGTNEFERSQHPDRNRRIHFYNLPPKCTIRIFTLDGDLVREIAHDVAPSDPLSTHELWDLITRNTQLAVSGLYYWTVEASDGSVQIGKLVLIM
ncbi:MAG: hypothetical protein HY966_00345, partial [Ignavibacteriales bacterium]|nr:hypothetical protein [Ignavibacteriales bacterium]